MTSEALKRDYVEAYIKQNPGCSLVDLQVLDGSKQAIWQRVRSLKTAERIASYGNGKAGLYFPINDFWTEKNMRIASATKQDSVRVVAGYSAKNSPVTHMDVVKQTNLDKSVAFRALRKLESVEILSKLVGEYFIDDGAYSNYANLLRGMGVDPSKYEFLRSGEYNLPKLENQKERIAAAISDRPGLTIKELASHLEIEPVTVLRHQTELADEGRIQRIKCNRLYRLFPTNLISEDKMPLVKKLPERTRDLYILASKVFQRLES